MPPVNFNEIESDPIYSLIVRAFAPVTLQPLHPPHCETCLDLDEFRKLLVG